VASEPPKPKKLKFDFRGDPPISICERSSPDWAWTKPQEPRSAAAIKATVSWREVIPEVPSLALFVQRDARHGPKRYLRSFISFKPRIGAESSRVIVRGGVGAAEAEKAECRTFAPLHALR
jgi:hypothetical protein